MEYHSQRDKHRRTWLCEYSKNPYHNPLSLRPWYEKLQVHSIFTSVTFTLNTSVEPFSKVSVLLVSLSLPRRCQATKRCGKGKKVWTNKGLRWWTLIAVWLQCRPRGTYGPVQRLKEMNSLQGLTWYILTVVLWPEHKPGVTEKIRQKTPFFFSSPYSIMKQIKQL